MKVLVTGGAGFIGSRIAEELAGRGFEVRVLDNFSAGTRENVAHLLDDIELIEGDIRDPEAVKKAVRGAGCVFHHAAIASVPRSISDPAETNGVNVTGTLNVLLASRDENVRRVVFASSSAVYGNSGEGMKNEDMAPDPLSPYAASKLMGEYYCRIFCSAFGLETIALRYFNVFGPGQSPFSDYAAVIPKFISLMLKGGQPVIYGDGRQSRDFIYVRDVARANILAMTAAGAAGRAYNIASGKSTDLNMAVEILNKILGSDIRPVYAGARSGDIMRSEADAARAEKFLGFSAGTDFEEGLKKTVEYFSGSVFNIPVPA